VEFVLWLWESGWIFAILRGSVVTLFISAASMGFGLLLGVIFGLIKWGKIRPFSYCVDFYTSIIRGVPELLIIYLLFFSSVEFVTQLAAAFGYTKSIDSAYPFIIAILAVGLISGAYSTEVVRGALSAIPKGHIEAAHALGLSRWRIFRRIIMPQMLRIAVPGLNNIWQITIKDTALVSVVGLQELMRTATVGAGSTRQPLLFYLVAALVYFAITLISQSGFDRLERLFKLDIRRVGR